MVGATYASLLVCLAYAVLVTVYEGWSAVDGGAKAVGYEHLVREAFPCGRGRCP